MGALPLEAAQGARPERLRRGDPGGDRRGKLAALAALLREHGDALEADLLRFYGVDLLDLWRGGLSLRRLSVLVNGLPTDSATWAALQSVPYGWTPTEYLLADLFHALAGEAHPGRPSATSSKSSADEKVARLLAQRERLEARRRSQEAPPA